MESLELSVTPTNVSPEENGAVDDSMAGWIAGDNGMCIGSMQSSGTRVRLDNSSF
ncbi:MAG: hypothetical protein HQL76_15330 [Magnetococcales bacterium]|nr:hypothetical protein [Magnetococcales bacterium]